MKSIITWAIDILYHTVPSEYRVGFSKDNVKINITRARVLSILASSIVTVVLGMSFIPFATGYYGDAIWLYRGMFAFIILLTFLVYLYLTMFYRSEDRPLVVGIAVVLFLNWAVVLTLIDGSRGIQSGGYYFNALAASILVVLRPSRSFKLFASSLLIYIGGTLLFITDTAMGYSNIINGFSFILSSWIISIVLYRLRGKDYVKQRIIESQNELLGNIVNLDPLTGLYNRRPLDEHLNQLYSKALEDGQPLSVMMIDIDYFKGYNDTYGHVKGDHILKAIAQRIQSIISRHDGYGYRYGGDEILILILNMAKDDLSKLKQEINHSIKIMKIENKTSVISQYVTLSSGSYTKIPTKTDEPWDFINEADKQLYDAKGKRGQT